MKYKYLIPVLVGAMLVATIAPASASTYELSPTQSMVYPGNSISWYGSFTDPSQDVSAGDNFKWYNWWYHNDATYQGAHTVGVSYAYSNSDNYMVLSSHSLTYQQSWSVDTTTGSISGSPTFMKRYHSSEYGDGTSTTSVKTVYLT